MTELEKLLRADLHDVADDVDIPVSLDAVVAERDRLDRSDRRTRWGRIALAALVVALVVAGVWWAGSALWRTPDTAVPNPMQSPSEPTPSPTPEPTVAAPSATPSAAPGTAAPTASGTPAGRTVAMFVYFVGTDSFPNLVREVRQVPAASPARGALEAMLAGPADPEASNLWNPGTTVLGIAKHGGVITVDLSRQALDFNLGAAYEGYMVGQLVYTVTEAFEPTDRVLITIEGQPFVTGHNVYDQPMGRGVENMIRLVIDTPAHGSTVSSPVRVTGLAAAFEGMFTWTVTRTDGSAVAEGVGQAGEGMASSPYAFDLPPLDPGEYVLRITLDDPSAGEGTPPASESKAFIVR